MSVASSPAAPLPYEIHGQGPPLLLLHGALVARTYWQPQLDTLAPHARVIACDLRGHGAAANLNGPFSVAGFAQDVLDLLDHLGLDHVVCCGHSLGGMVAQELALSAPERVRGLILADTWYDPRGDWWEPVPMRTFMLRWMLAATRVEDMVALMAHGLGRLNPAITPYAQTVMGQYIANRRAYLQIWDAAMRFNSAARLHQIACPTLVLVSDRFAFTYMQARAMQRRIPGAELVEIPNSGHWVNWDNPAAFNAAVLDFLARRCRS